MKVIYFFCFIILISCNRSFTSRNENIKDMSFDELLSQCNGDSCCEHSVNAMKGKNGLAIKDGENCPAGHNKNKLRCISSYTWCELE